MDIRNYADGWGDRMKTNKKQNMICAGMSRQLDMFLASRDFRDDYRSVRIYLYV